jgi:lysozyme
MGGNTLGVDLSYCNEVNPDGYAVMKTGGVRFAYIKVTQGVRIYDNLFESHWANSKAAGILRGVYHMYEPLASSDDQVNFLKSHYPADSELPLALDVEIDLQATNDYLIKDIGNFLKLAEQTFQRRPIIYTGSWWWEPNMSPTPGWAAGYDFWLASYPYAPGKVEITWEQLPNYLPSGWVQPVSGGRKARIWQFSGDKFSLPGVQGALDLNMFDGDEAALRAWAGVAPLPITPTMEERLAKLEAEARAHGWNV